MKTEVKTKLDNVSYITQALDELGIKYKVAKEGETLETKGQYNVKERVEILVTEVNGRSTDAIGFQKQSDGTFACTGDFYCVGISKEQLKNKTTTKAKKIETNDRLMQLGFTMDGEVENDKEVELTYTRWV